MRFLSFVLLSIATVSVQAQTRLFVVDGGGAAVTVIDARENRTVASIPVSPGPQALGLSPEGRLLYVTGSLHSAVEAVDVRTLKVVKTSATGPKPDCLAISPDGRRAFICLGTQSGLDVVDTAPMQRLRTIFLEGPGSPRNLYVTPDSTRFIAAGDHKLTVINIRIEKPEFTIPVEGVAGALAIESDKHLVIGRLFVAVAGTKGFEVIDYASRKLAGKVPMTAAVTSLAVTVDRKSLWVVAGDEVSEFALPDLKKIATVPVDRGPSAILCSEDSKRCYVSNSGGGTVSVIDTATAKEIARIPAGKNPGRMILSDGVR